MKTFDESPAPATSNQLIILGSSSKRGSLTPVTGLNRWRSDRKTPTTRDPNEKNIPSIIRLPGGEPLITRLQLQVGSKSKIRGCKKLIVAGKRRSEQLLERERERERERESWRERERELFRRDSDYVNRYARFQVLITVYCDGSSRSVHLAADYTWLTRW